jgi:hypothetical protein
MVKKKSKCKHAHEHSLNSYKITSDSQYIVFESDSSCSNNDEDETKSVKPYLYPTLVINVKRVRFSNETITHVIEIEDRKGYWVEDRFRFQQRCASIRDAISFIFDEMHRRRMRLIVNMSDTIRGSSQTNKYFTRSYDHHARGTIALPMPTWWRS